MIAIYEVEMGTITAGHIDDVLIFKAEGSLTYRDITDAIKEHSAKATRHIVWHLTDATTDDLTDDLVMGLPELAKQHLTNRKGGKTAFICSSDVLLGMSRLYSIVSELTEAPYRYNTFSSVDEALEWLRE